MCHHLVVLLHSKEAQKLNIATQLCDKERASISLSWYNWRAWQEKDEDALITQGSQTSSEKPPYIYIYMHIYLYIYIY